MTAFWIKGDDGDEYGPTEVAEMREWLRENRIGPDTPVRRDGGDAAWEPFQKFPELVGLLAERREAAGPFSSPLFQPASYSARLAAYLLDSLIVAIFALLVLTAVNPRLPAPWRVDPASFSQVLVNDTEPSPEQTLFVLGLLFLRIGYYTWFHGRTGQTPGKWLFGVRVVDGMGLTIGYRKAFIRAIGSFFAEVPWFVGYAVVFFTPYRRALQDLLAGTFVVQLRRDKSTFPV